MKTASNSRVLRTITLLIAFCLVSMPAQAQYGGGNGGPNDPYLIYTTEQMNAIGLHGEDWDKHFKLMADIDLIAYKGTDFNIIGYYVDYSDNKPFTGVFDGNGHTISNFSYTSTDTERVGLFGYVEGGTIKDLGLIDPTVDAGTGDRVGSLVGYMDEGTINNCYAEGAHVAGHDCVGGLVGKNWLDSTITNCYSTGSVTGNEKIGGLLGEKHATVTNCYAAAIVSGINDVGGLVGYICCGTTSDCYAMGTVVGDKCVGGLVGSESGMWTRGGTTILRCYSVGSVTGTQYVGGLVGNGGGYISTSYSTGAVTGNDYVGGLVGSGGNITTSYSTGTVSGDRYVGGLVGSGGQGVLHSVWDMETSGLTVSDGGVGLTTAEMMDPYMLGLYGFANDPNWILDAGRDYPRLATVSVSHRIEFSLLAHWKLDETEGDIAQDSVGDNDVFVIGDLLWLPTDGKVDGALMLDGQQDFINVNDIGINSVDAPFKISLWSKGGASGQVLLYVCGLDPGYLQPWLWIDPVDGKLTAQFMHPDKPLKSERDVTDGQWHEISIVWDGSYRYLVVDAGITSEDAEPVDAVGNDKRAIIGAGRNIDPASCWEGMIDDVRIYEGRFVEELAWDGTPGQIIPDPIIDWLDGQGTEEEPYRIDTADQLIFLSRASGLWDKHFILGADINLDPILQGRQVFSQAVIQVFSGIFDGNDHTISHLTITGGSYLGLFGELGSGAIISNLGIEAVDVNGTDFVGGLVGYNDGGNITNSYSIGTVTGDDYVGGLVGRGGNITNSYSIGTVSGGRYVGGLVGDNSGSITTSYSTGTVSGFDSVGGLVGSSGGSITMSYSTGTVSGNENVGGLVGDNRGIITNCYSTGSVSGNERVGGLVGYNYGTIDDCSATGGILGDRYVGGLVGRNSEGTITICYSSGDVSGDRYVAGLVGANWGSITNCSATSTVSGMTAIGGLVGDNRETITNCYVDGGSVSANISVGGLVGNNYEGTISNSYSTASVSGMVLVGGLLGWNISGTVIDAFWDIQTSGQSTSDGGTGKTTAEMQTASTFLDAGWDFVGESVNGTEDIWWILEGLDYPRLWLEATSNDVTDSKE